MIKFIHKKHINPDKENGKIIIYYNVTDIFLGTVLLILVVFFIHDYLSHVPGIRKDNEVNLNLTNQTYGNPLRIK